MKYRSLLVAVLGVAMCITCCSGAVYHASRPSNGIWIEDLEADLNAQLPDGSTWGQAEAWFSSRGIQTNDIVGADGRKIGLEGFVPNDTIVQHADIWIELYFSPDWRLEKRVIYRQVHFL